MAKGVTVSESCPSVRISSVQDACMSSQWCSNHAGTGDDGLYADLSVRWRQDVVDIDEGLR